MKAFLVLIAICCLTTATARAQNLEPNPPAPRPRLSIPLQDALMFLETKGEGRLIEPKIFGGLTAQAGDDPWQVGLVPASAAQIAVFCGGSVIAARWVVTAAHCVDNGTPAAAVDIFTGSNNLDSGGRRITVRNIFVRPDYRPDPAHRNDIALLELNTPLPQSAIIAVLDPARQDTALKKNTPARVTGWGLVAPDARGGVRELRYVELLMKTNVACNDATKYDGRIKPEMVCAGSSTNPGDACKGDSGGPLTIRLDDVRVLAALVSWGALCGTPGFYGVYTRLAPFTTWISDCQAGRAQCLAPASVTAEAPGRAVTLETVSSR
jgi:secreted trypsin-like serine protease